MARWTSVNQGPLSGDPFVLWKALRPGSAATRRYLVELRTSDPDEADAILAGLQMVATPAYRTAGTRFWTARGGTPPTNPPGTRPRAGITSGEVYLRLGRLDLSKSKLDLTTRLRLMARNVGQMRLFRLSAPSSAVATPGASRPVIGVIDDWLPFLHAHLRRPGTGEAPPTTRLISFWDQTESAAATAPRWQIPTDFGYGREMPASQIDQVLATVGQTSERACYAQIDHKVPGDSPGWTHGGQVLGLAAGLVDPFANGHPPDTASDLDIIAVQLPPEAVARTHGTWLNTYVLDGLHFILSRAPTDAAVIVNISLAGSVGPRDGTSALEQAIDELIEVQNGRLTVVLAAGNGRGDGTHACEKLEPGQSMPLRVTIQPNDPTPNFIDICASGPQPVTLSMDVTKGSTASLSTGMAFVRTDDSGAATALAVLLESGGAPNGHGISALVGIGATLHDSVSAPAETGDWSVVVKNTGVTPALVHAWIARDDVPSGYPGATRSQLTFAEGVLDTRGTISSMAGGANAISVGGYLFCTAPTEAPTMFERSGEGFGPSVGFAAIRGPDVCGPAGVDGGGIPAAWFMSDEFAPSPNSPSSLRSVGTSMSAAIVTRRLANVIGSEPPGAWCGKPAALAKLASAYPSLKPAAAGPVLWTAEHWVGR